MAQSEEFWDRKRKSPFRWITLLVHLCLLYAGIFPLVLYGPQHKTFHTLALLFVFQAGWIVVTTVHELGHTLAAWGVGFRFVALNIGPLTVHRNQWGHRRIRVDWNRLTGVGGYAAAVPVSEDNLRSNATLMVFAGPFASLTAALVCWLLYLNLPGSGWEEYWGVPGILAVLFAADFGVNLVPIGYSDGSMLFHLLLWTRHGQDLYALHQAAKTHGEAAQHLVEQDFAGEVRLRRKALEQMLARGDAPSRQLGHSYQSLAYAQLNHSREREAEANFQKSIEVFGRCPGLDPIFEANSWKGLEKIHRTSQSVEDTRKAAYSAIAAYEKARAGNVQSPSAAGVTSAIAQLYADLRGYDAGLREVQWALALLREGSEHLVERADCLRIKMRCEAGLGQASQAKATALEAATLLRSPEISEKERNRAASGLGSLGASAWLAGVADTAAALLKESIQKLEERGPSSRAVGLRMALASIFRREGQWAEAEAALPPESAVEPERRKGFLEERAEVFAETGRVAQAVADAREALRLIGQEGEDDPVETASAQAKLAEFLLAEGKVEEAEDLASRARDQLLPRRHTDAAGALVTLALLGSGPSSEVLVEQAMAMIRDAPLVEAGTKHWALNSLNRRLKLRQPGSRTPVAAGHPE